MDILGTEAMFAAMAVMAMSLVGVVFSGQVARRFIEERLTYLISFSAGVFLVTALFLGFEVFEIADSYMLGAALIVVGYVLASGLHALLPETHHHHDESCAQSKKGARKLIIGDGIHNIADGIVLVSAFSVSSVVGIAATVSIMIHEALQEVSEYFVLRKAGYSQRGALLINFSVSATVLIGVGLGYFALASHDLEVLLLALSSGFFAHVVIHDLLPRQNHHESRSAFFRHILLVILGVAIMGLINVALSESHTHDDGVSLH